MKKYGKLILYALLTLCAIGYIFGNSLQSSAASNEKSSTVAAMVNPIINPNKSMADEEVNKIVRKIAHGVEFGILGVCLSLLTHEIGKLRKMRLISLPLLLALCVAVTDEFIQKYRGRTDTIKDVLIDFGGAVCGMVLVWLILLAFYKIRKKKEKLGG